MTPDPINLVANLNQNFQIFRGESKQLVVDMTGYDIVAATSIDWWLAKSPFVDIDDPEDVLAKKSLTDGITQDTGNLTIVLNAVDTDYAPDQYYHELKITSSTGVHVAMIGTVIIRMSLNMEATP
jgi:hypothetical protein